jgi:eukaryotic-like serine/threonine-protein kinase
MGFEGARLEPGTRLDRYELLCPVAHGGMASVWLARLSGKHGFEKLFAIKTILPQFAEDVRFQQMFLDEARVASRIEHANVAQVLDLGEEHGVLYLVMQWVDGDSLSRLSRAATKQRIKIPIPIVLRILADTCGGLHAAHEVRDPQGERLGVVHRDVSPQNILVTPEGVAKLIDFGVVKAEGRLSADTVAGQLKGKIHYMAREQALGELVDRRADVWSVAAVAYTLIAGAPPYEGPNELATLHMLTSGRPPPPLPPGVPTPVAEAILAGLVADPSLRTQTALELQQAFENAMTVTHSGASTADVGVFARQLLTDQHKSRKRALDAAMQAAEERRKHAEGLKPLRADSSSGVGPAQSGRSSVLAPITPLSEPASLTPGNVSESSPWAPRGAEGRGLLEASSVSQVGSVPSVASSATLGSANSEVQLPSMMAPKRALGVWVIAAMGVLVGIAGVLVVGILLRSSPAVVAPATSTVPPPEDSVTAAAAAPSTPGAAPAPPVATASAVPPLPLPATPDAGAPSAVPAKPPAPQVTRRPQPPPPQAPARKDYGF